MFESRKKAKEEREKQAQHAVERGWALVGGYQLELIDDLFERYGVEGEADPYGYTQFEVDLSSEDREDRVAEDEIHDPFPPLAPPPQRRVRATPTESVDRGRSVGEPLSSLDDAQCRVVKALDTACTGWFGFFFRTLSGTDLERREIAAQKLTAASRDLTKAAKDLADADDLPPERLEGAALFRMGIEGWAEAFDAIARGMMLDQQRVANEGLDMMIVATEQAEKAELYSVGASKLAVTTFEYLDELAPPPGGSKSVARRAKEPWRRATRAAGSTQRSLRRSKLDRRG